MTDSFRCVHNVNLGKQGKKCRMHSEGDDELKGDVAIIIVIKITENRKR